MKSSINDNATISEQAQELLDAMNWRPRHNEMYVLYDYPTMRYRFICRSVEREIANENDISLEKYEQLKRYGLLP